MVMRRKPVHKPADDLAALLQRLIALQDAIYQAQCEKLEAMRQADSDGMVAAAGREGALAQEVASLEGRRRQIISQLCEDLKMPADIDVGAVSIRMLVARLDQGRRDHLLKLTDELREKMLRVAEKNQVVEMVSREMLSHFKTLFDVMMKDDRNAPTYSPSGEIGMAGGSRVLDAVG